ncbi:YceD family protein [Jiella sonneratiae]|uniref:DUF177 domain-containing protein n=1 Tax=Jiella sonneratiae TaxID=2816856 RepID=A0ABS3J2D9_9HYPH|nr:DUF177 domain-containing protein [Jiella sonneratiae]MBO0903825.1 DUF177 domain-containing protein [Jiella sonneratiae]
MPSARSAPLDLWLPVAGIGEAGRQIDYAASAAECARLAEALGVESVAGVAADLLARPFRRDGARVSGRVTAVVVQKSVVSLEPVEQRIDEPFEATFLPESARARRSDAGEAAEIVVDPEAEDPPEAFSGGRIDLGERLFEVMSLALDPYPRRSGESFSGAPAKTDDEAGSSGAPSPFAALTKFPRPGGDDAE